MKFKFKEKYHEKQYVEQRNISYAEVAEAIGVTRAAVRLWLVNEAKFVNLETLDKLCDYFKCEPGDLLVRVPNEGSSIAS